VFEKVTKFFKLTVYYLVFKPFLYFYTLKHSLLPNLAVAILYQRELLLFLTNIPYQIVQKN